MNISSQSDFSQLAQPFIHYSRSYFDKIKSSLITKEDLRKLYGILAKKSDEAADIQLTLSPNLPENVKEIFKNLKNKLWIQIWGENNEYISGDHESIFDDERLPKKIMRINFNSYNGYQIASQNRMQNWLELQFDFKKNQIFDFFSKITDPSNQNNSYISVQGTNETWVDGVYQAINSFLKDKTLSRDWLYSKYIYDTLLYILFFPLIFRSAYLLGLSFNLSDLPMPLMVAIYIYIFIISLYLFRFIFNYAKWLFPLIELENGSSLKQRLLLFAIIIGVLGSGLYDLLKLIIRFILNI